MATHSSILPWKIPWTEDPGRLQSMGSQRVGTTERLHFTSLQVPHITGAIRYLPFCIWLILPSIMTTKFIHDIRNASEFPSILRLNNIPSMDCMEVKPVDPKGNQS